VGVMAARFTQTCPLPIAAIVGSEVGEVTSSYIADGVTHYSVVFLIYGGEVAGVRADWIELVDQLDFNRG